ncbi:cytochrome b5 [Irpex rosettiformis]|uniref:Cytochrome b5 n=1 Tax=Irpex rosettiformis TaxID=378272 RepID=A0ACB8TTF3_9APHY|nr:cytochrome b5 [Irpex rosettiformis]
MSFDLGLPVNTALAFYILYCVQRIVFPSTKVPAKTPTEFKEGYTWIPKAHPPTLLFKTYTPKTLSPFNGENGQRILLSIKGVVYDVTAGRSFYGPNGMYANFAGRDASRGMAKQSFDEEMLTPIDQPLDKLEDLKPDEIENMNGWMDHFSSKYIICGNLVENGQE